MAPNLGGLQGRTYVVTGVSRRAGIGYAIARRLLAEGANVVAHGWGAYDATQPYGADIGLHEHLQDLGGEMASVSADFAEPDAPALVMGFGVAQFGHIDGIVVNHTAGIGGRLADVTAETLDRAFAVNARAPILLAQAFAAQHDGRPGGRVVLFTSGQHLGGMPREVPYAVSKGAVQQATATLAAELAPRGITVNCINPGPTDTGWADPATYEAVRQSMPQGRWGQPDDVANLVVWLLGDEAQWICGQTINSEGGFDR
jgi:3-oxoacyl-[acyl-carrier protein] reductase